MKRTTKQKESYTSHILTNDPSITAWGWAVLNWQNKVVDAGCIKTASLAKKLRIRKGDDRVRRISEINRELNGLIRKYNVNFIVSELPHGSQNAAAAVMIGVTTAMVQSFADLLKIGVEWYSEADAKKCALGKSSATKKEMIDRMKHLYKWQWTGIKYKDEAVADALAVHYAAIQMSATLKVLRNENIK